MKECLKCNKVLNEINFSQNKLKKDGLDIYCKECAKNRATIYRNKNKTIPSDKICKKCNIEKKFSEFHKNNASLDGLRNTCKSCRRNINQDYNIQNKKKIRLYNIDYRSKNKDYLNRKNKQYKKQRMEKDDLFKLKHNTSCLIRECFKNRSFKKDSKSKEILGCSWKNFVKHLEDNEFGFRVGQEGIDLDHIVPISSANSKEEVMKLNHFSNFQLLPTTYNRVVKINKEFDKEHFKQWLKLN
ncbi:MAG: hypothetical protein KC414_05515 [Romboutsia sp.]|nr:hypothetical protein [Romboutsia sp.]